MERGRCDAEMGVDVVGPVVEDATVAFHGRIELAGSEFDDLDFLGRPSSGVVEGVFKIEPLPVLHDEHPALGRDDSVWNLPSGLDQGDIACADQATHIGA